MDGRDATPDDTCAMRDWLVQNGARVDLDIVAEGETPADDAIAGHAHVAPWAEAGCTSPLPTTPSRSPLGSPQARPEPRTRHDASSAHFCREARAHLPMNGSAIDNTASSNTPVMPGYAGPAEINAIAALAGGTCGSRPRR